jgi:hypothetical protein
VAFFGMLLYKANEIEQGKDQRLYDFINCLDVISLLPDACETVSFDVEMS